MPPVPAGGDAPFRAEFLVGNRNVEELLPEAARELFLQASAGVWGRGDTHIINITSALDRGGRVPLPIEGRREGYGQGWGAEGGPGHTLGLPAGVSGSPPARAHQREAWRRRWFLWGLLTVGGFWGPLPAGCTSRWAPTAPSRRAWSRSCPCRAAPAVTGASVPSPPAPTPPALL